MSVEGEGVSGGRRSQTSAGPGAAQDRPGQKLESETPKVEASSAFEIYLRFVGRFAEGGGGEVQSVLEGREEQVGTGRRVATSFGSQLMTPDEVAIRRGPMPETK